MLLKTNLSHKEIYRQQVCIYTNVSGHAKTVLVTKVKGTDEILGGYNPFAWDNTYSGLIPDGKWMETKDSFIFSLKNGNIQNSILSRVKNTRYAINNVSKNSQTKLGSYFGDFWMYSDKSDFTLDDVSYCRSYGCYYEKPIRSSSSCFPIINYEVFKIVRKTI